MKKTNKCRCCLSGGCYKDLSNSYMFDGKLENYGDMLTKTFNLTLNHLKQYICEDCIIRLRDAVTFKQQIQDAGITFTKIQNENGADCQKSNEIKVESSDNEEWLFILEDKDAIHNVKSEALDKATNEKDLTEDLSNIEMSKIKVNKKVTKIQSKKIKNVKGHRKVKTKNSTEEIYIKDQRENSVKLISNSNLCLFKSLRTRFSCYVCLEEFYNIKELKIHTEKHTTDEVIKKFRRSRGASFENVDITNLTCKICSENCTNLDILKTHLIERHSLIFADIRHILIPYKLEEGFHCAICKDSFNTFTRLSIHMNKHATSNVCETCGNAFFNRVNLRHHIQSVHTELKCPECDLIFSTRNKLNSHKRKVHNAPPIKHHCLRCSVTFPYTYQLKNHMVGTHGDKYNTVDCSICKKIFKNHQLLNTHFRTVHLNERNFPCTICDLRFHTRNGQRRHEETHGNSSYSCNHCDTKFKNKDSIRRHMKNRHLNIF